MVTAHAFARSPRPLAWLAACVALGVPRAAAALEVTWQAASVCPTHAELAQRIEHALGVPLPEAPSGQFTARAVRTAQGYEARLEVDSADSAAAKVRLLRAADCDKLADMVALSVALALSSREPVAASFGAAQAPKPSTNEASSAPAPDTARAPSKDEREHDATASRGPALGLTASLLADAGTQPRFAVGPALGVQVSWAHVQVRASAALFANQEVDGSNQGEFAVYPGYTLDEQTLAELRRERPMLRVRAVLANLLACGSLWGSFRGEYALALCAGAEVGNMRVEPIDSDFYFGPTNSSWLAPSANAGGFIGVPSTSLRVGAWVGAAVAPGERVELYGTSARFETADVRWRASLGLDWLLW